MGYSITERHYLLCPGILEVLAGKQAQRTSDPHTSRVDVVGMISKEDGKSIQVVASLMASATPRLPPDHATALQHRRQGACEDSDVMLKGHK